jgi:hypothetical protein
MKKTSNHNALNVTFRTTPVHPQGCKDDPLQFFTAIRIRDTPSLILAAEL